MMKKETMFLLVLVALAAGCAKNRVSMLSDRADSYNRSLRWSSLTAASVLIEEKSRGTVLQQLANEMNRSRIVDYSIVDLGTDSEKVTASVIVEFSYIDNIAQDVRYRQEIQNWKYDSKKNEWFLTGYRETASGR